MPENYTEPFYAFNKRFNGVSDFGYLPPLEYLGEPVGEIKALKDRIKELETDNIGLRKILLSFVNNKDIRNLISRKSLTSNISNKEHSYRGREKELEAGEAQTLIQKLVGK